MTDDAFNPATWPGAQEMHDVVVVGGGLFGTIVAKKLSLSGHGVTLLDVEHPRAASPAAACLMRPSWISALGRDDRRHALATLDELYGVEDIAFNLPAKTKLKMPWVRPERIFDRAHARAFVRGVGVHEGRPYVVALCGMAAGASEKEERAATPTLMWANKLIVAAGVWTRRFVAVPDLVGRAGAAVIWDDGDWDPEVVKPSVRLYLPYKQLVSLPDWRPGLLWVGDGTSPKPESWSLQREAVSIRRCAAFVRRSASRARTIYGVRPLVRGLREPCFVEEVCPNLWAVTGGAKNGVLAAGWAAYRMAEALD